MVSTYVLVKLFHNASNERLEENEACCDEANEECYSDKCRICLKDGSIPIYGDTNLPSAIQDFGDIQLCEDDEHPKHLCDSCHDLLKSAMLFRKIAKQSNKILQKTNTKVKEECSSKEVGDIRLKELIKKEMKKCKPSLLEKFFLEIPSHIDECEHIGNRPKKKVQCRICSKIISKAYYKEHFSIHDPTLPRHICDICGKTFRQRCAYRNHLFTHSSEFPHKCPMCPYRGRNTGLLKTHMRTHTGDYRYMCAECPSKFLTKSNLNKHILRHRQPAYQCNSCKRSFHALITLERHYEAEHLGIKKHLCNMCGKAFGYRKAMMRHQLDVHKREKRLNGRMPAYLQAEYMKEFHVSD